MKMAKNDLREEVDKSVLHIGIGIGSPTPGRLRVLIPDTRVLVTASARLRSAGDRDDRQANQNDRGSK
jgi:hypothetical protein